MLKRTWAAALALGLAAIGLGSFNSQPASATIPTADVAPSFHVVLPWGSGAGQVGLRPAQSDFPADGPSSLAITPDGSVYVLDRLNHRVLRVDRHQGTTEFTEVPADAEDITASDDAAIGVYSPLRARLWVHEGRQVVAEVSVPRGLRELLDIDFGPSRQVIVRSAHQETFRLGPPSAPQTLPSILHSKREGAYQLPDGTGLAAKLDDQGRAELILIDNAAERARVLRTLPIDNRRVLSARVLGLQSTVACVRLEHELSDAPIRVHRTVSCLDISDGTRLLNVDLGPVQDTYVPRRSFAMGGKPLRLVFMKPAKDGLHVKAWDVPRAGKGGSQ